MVDFLVCLPCLQASLVNLLAMISSSRMNPCSSLSLVQDNLNSRTRRHLTNDNASLLKNNGSWTGCVRNGAENAEQLLVCMEHMSCATLQRTMTLLEYSVSLETIVAAMRSNPKIPRILVFTLVPTLMLLRISARRRYECLPL